MGVDVDVDGLAAFTATAADAAAQLADLDQVNAQVAADIVDAVEAPRLTGRLASTVTAVPEGAGFRVTAGGERAPYAGIVHARTRFLNRALEARQRAAETAYEDHVTDTVNTITGA
jgi:hypothetical protein